MSAGASTVENLVIWGLLLLGASLVLIIIEVFVPSAGLISLLSAALGISGLVCLYRYDWVWGAIGTLGMLVLAPVAFFSAMNILPSTPMGKKLLFGDQGKDEPGIAQGGEEERLAVLIGAEGTAVTDLRPVGTVKIDGQRVQARSETSIVSAGSKVRVTGVDGFVLKVRPVA